MHDTQEKLWRLCNQRSLLNLTLRDIGKLIEVKGSPQKIKHHLDQLISKGLIRPDYSPIKAGLDEKTGIVNLPIMGNCY